MAKKAQYGTLGWKDIGRGLFMAFGAAFLASITQLLTVDFKFEYMTIKPALISGISGGVIYLIKNVFTNSDDKMFKKES